MFRVIQEFYDLQDAVLTKGGTIYHHYMPGDIYPRAGLEPSAARIEELSGSGNAQRAPLIEAATQTEPESAESEQAADMPEKESEQAEAELKPKRTRKK